MSYFLSGAMNFGKAVGVNLGMSSIMYGAMGVMSYDESTSDPYNHTAKMGAGLAADQIQDAAIFGGGALISKTYSGLQGLGIIGDLGATGQKMMNAGSVSMMAKNAGVLGRAGGALRGGAGIATKTLDFGLRHATGIGMAGVMAAALFAKDLGMMAMDGYDYQEAKYKRMQSHPGFHLSQSSSRFLQDQLYSMRGAGHEAEIMHN